MASKVRYIFGFAVGAFAFVVISYALFLQASCRTDAPLYETISDESYGPDVRNKMDVYLPSRRDSAAKTVILIHGGGWVAGDKKDFGNSEFADRLLRDGFAVAAINYRYACGDYHKQMDDIRFAIGHLRLKAADWKLDDSSFALIGGSAGGYLALLYAHAFDTLNMVKAVVSLVGPTDLTDTLFHHHAANYQLGYVLEQLLGATIQENPQVYQDASPLFHRSNVPTLFICGKLDDLVPYQQSVHMHDSLSIDGVATDIMIFANANHNVLGDKNENAADILDAVSNWMLLYLK